MRLPFAYSPREDVKAAAAPLIHILYASVLQGALMALATVLISRGALSEKWLHEFCRYLSDYVPALWRYRDVFHAMRREDEFAYISSVYCSYLVLQLIFFGAVLIMLYRKIELRSAGRAGFPNSWGLWLMPLFVLYAYAVFLLGPISIERSDLVSGRYSGLFAYCAVLPCANFALGFVVLAEFGKAMQKLRRSELERPREISGSERR